MSATPTKQQQIASYATSMASHPDRYPPEQIVKNVALVFTCE